MNMELCLHLNILVIYIVLDKELSDIENNAELEKVEYVSRIAQKTARRSDIDCRRNFWISKKMKKIFVFQCHSSELSDPAANKRLSTIAESSCSIVRELVGLCCHRVIFDL